MKILKAFSALLLTVILATGLCCQDVEAAAEATGRDEQKILTENSKKLGSSKAGDRRDAIESLSKVRGKDNREKAGKTLSDRLKREKNTNVKGILIDALARMKSKGTGKMIADTLYKEKSTALRLQMINILGKLKYKDAKGILRRLLESKVNKERLYSASALAGMGDGSGMAILEKIVLDKKESRGSRSFAVRSFGKIKDEKAVDILGKLMDDDDFAIRLQAISALGKIGGVGAEVLILKAKDDTDERVRILAERLLKRK